MSPREIVFGAAILIIIISVLAVWLDERDWRKKR